MPVQAAMTSPTMLLVDADVDQRVLALDGGELGFERGEGLE